MGVTYALLAMTFFAANIIITRYALVRMPVEAGFFIVLATNILFPTVLFAVELGLRTMAPVWDWRGVGMFAFGGVIGTFLGRRMLFDTVRLLGPSRASVFHSTAPAFALAAAGFGVGDVLRGIAMREWNEAILGAIVSALAMNHIEIALAVLVIHTTPPVIFPVSVFILKNREELTPRTLLGALPVLSGIALLALR